MRLCVWVCAYLQCAHFCVYVCFFQTFFRLQNAHDHLRAALHWSSRNGRFTEPELVHSEHLCVVYVSCNEPTLLRPTNWHVHINGVDCTHNKLSRKGRSKQKCNKKERKIEVECNYWVHVTATFGGISLSSRTHIQNRHFNQCAVFTKRATEDGVWQINRTYSRNRSKNSDKISTKCVPRSPFELIGFAGPLITDSMSHVAYFFVLLFWIVMWMSTGSYLCKSKYISISTRNAFSKTRWFSDSGFRSR